MIEAPNSVQIWVGGLDRRAYAVLIGVIIGVVGGLTGLLLALAGPVVAFGAVLGLLAGVYILTDVSAALYGLIGVMALLPFGTLPVRIGFTPTLLDAAVGAFLLVYLAQWMTGRRRGFRFVPVHVLIVLYVGWLLLSFALGMRYAPPTSAILRQFAEMLVSIAMTFILVDLLRDRKALRRLVLVILAFVGIQAAVTVVLYALPNDLTENILVRLARIGYPNGGVIRYLEDNPALAERAIGTWVDPNALGGVLAVSSAMFAPQLFAAKPVLRWRWLTALVLGIVALALVLTFSRASMLAFGIALLFIAVMRYRQFYLLMLIGLIAFLLLPQSQGYIERFIDAFTGSDLATQMRIGEYTDSFRLISRYPIFGIGFTGTPEIDIYAHAASLYLIMANQIGLVGLGIYLVTIASVFIYGFHSWRKAKHDPLLDAVHLGFHAALLAAMINGVADLYFFRTDFQASNLLFWLTVALALASSKLALSTRSAETSDTRGNTSSP